MEKRAFLLRSAALVLLLFSLSSLASAKDDILATVTPLSGPTPIIVENGNPPGTIHVLYTVIGFTWPASGLFASVTIELEAQEGKGKDTEYPLTLNLTQKQQGEENLIVTPGPASFEVVEVGWSDSSAVTVSIPAIVPEPEDGATMVGVLQLETEPQHALRTAPTVIFKLTLVHPNSCLMAYNFITDQEYMEIVPSTLVNVNKKGNVNSLNPFGQLSDNILIVNTCAFDVSFDLLTLLDSTFRTNPHNNPGNAVFTYFPEGFENPGGFIAASGEFGAETVQGQQLCLTDITLAVEASFLATVHMEIIRRLHVSALPSGGEFLFTAELYLAGSGCTGDLSGDAIDNPVTVPLPFTIKTPGNGNGD